MKKILSISFLLLFIAGYGYAQRTVSGTIKDTNDEPLIGANILIDGTGTGTIADINGNFSLEVNDGDVLLISYTGYNTQEITVSSATSFDIVMSFDAVGLEDVIIVGYSPQKRKDVTGAIASVKSADIENIQLPSIETALQGRAAGVQVVKNSGKPGGGIDVNIRGRTSITASNQPLYVIDGVPVISGDNFDFAQEGIGGSNVSVLADLNPEDIESIEVLKDAATAAAYGSRAANGVVLITTKKGSKTGTKISLNASYGQQWLPKKIETITGDEYQQYISEIFGPLLTDVIGVEANYQNVQDFLLGPLGEANTNWQDEVFYTSPIAEYSANISGGNENTQYYASLGFSDDQGIIRNSFFKRYSGRLNVNHAATDKLNFSMNLGYTNSNTQQVQNDNNIFGVLGASILIPPVVPIRNEDGTWGGAFGIENAVAAVTDYRNNILRGRVIGNVAASYSILNNLTFKATFGVDILNSNETIYEPRTLQSSTNGRAVVATVADTRFIHDYVLNFSEAFGKSNFNAYVGTSFQEDEINSTFTEAVNFPTDGFTGLSSGAEPVTTNGTFTGDNLKSFFGGINYSFDGKYFIAATFRADGSSRFINNRWGYFPGVSAGWNITNDFLKGNGVFDLLKLRAGWGQTGNNIFDNFDAFQLYNGGRNYRDLPGTAPSQIGNPDLKWETTTQTNIGLDFAFLNNRISGSIDFYIKDTEDLILDRPIPTTSGFTSVLQNVGEVRNTGIDLSLTTLNFDRSNFTWSTTFTVGYLKNEVLTLVDGIPFDAGFSNRIAEGQSIGAFFGHLTDGIFQNQAEIDAAPTQPGAEPGDIRFMDIGGGAGEDGILATADDLPADGAINDDDRTYIGKALPDFMGGITNNINFKGLEISAFFQFATGHQIMNFNNAFAEGLNGVFSPTRRAWENRWQQEGDQTEIPRLIRNDPNGNRRDSDRFVEDADYIRLKSLTIGYRFPKSALANWGISDLKIYASGYNLWTATGYTWYDPEVNMFDGSNTALGTDFLSFPQPRSIVFGINLGF